MTGFDVSAVRGSAEPGQEADQLPGARAEQPGCEEAARGALADLAERRIGGNHPGERLDVQPLADRQYPDLDQLAGLRPKDRGTEDPAGFGRHRLQQAVGLALRLSAVVLLIGPAQ